MYMEIFSQVDERCLIQNNTKYWHEIQGMIRLFEISTIRSIKSVRTFSGYGRVRCMM